MRLFDLPLLICSLFSLLASVSSSNGQFVNIGPTFIEEHVYYNNPSSCVARLAANNATIFAASANGGIWSSDDLLSGGPWKRTSIPTWRPLTDSQPCLSMSAIAIAPFDSRLMAAGCGVESSSNGAGEWRGVMLSSDAGRTWTLAQSFQQPLMLYRVTAIRITGSSQAPGIIVATRAVKFPHGSRSDGLLFASTDWGQSWSVVKYYPNAPIFDLAQDNSNPNMLLMTVADASPVHISNDGGATWAPVTTPPVWPDCGAGTLPVQARMARNPVDGRTVLVMETVAASPPCLKYGYAYALGASPNTWTSFVGPSLSDGLNEQLVAITSDPSDSNLVYVAGFSVRLFRIDIAGGTITNLMPGTSQLSPRPIQGDFKSILFDPLNNTRLYIASDGGVYGLENPSSNGTWTYYSFNGNMTINEVYHINYDSKSRTIMAGVQDLGVIAFSRSTGHGWITLPCDGGPIDIDESTTPSTGYMTCNSLFVTGAYQFNQQPPLDGSNRLYFLYTQLPSVLNAAQLTWTVSLRRNINPNYAPGRVLTCGNTVCVTLHYDFNNQSILNFDIAYNPSNGISQFQWGGYINGILQSTLLFGVSTSLSYAIIPATGVTVLNRRVPWADYSTDGPITTIFDRFYVNPFNAQHALFTIARSDGTTQIYETIDLGAQWRDITGNLARRSGALVDPFAMTATILSLNTGLVILAGTRYGVYALYPDPGSSSIQTRSNLDWIRVDENLPSVPVTAFHYYSGDDTLFIGTLGRGIYELTRASIRLQILKDQQWGLYQMNQQLVSSKTNADDERNMWKSAFIASVVLLGISFLTSVGFLVRLQMRLRSGGGANRVNRHVQMDSVLATGPGHQKAPSSSSFGMTNPSAQPAADASGNYLADPNAARSGEGGSISTNWQASPLSFRNPNLM